MFLSCDSLSHFFNNTSDQSEPDMFSNELYVMLVLRVLFLLHIMVFLYIFSKQESKHIVPREIKSAVLWETTTSFCQNISKNLGNKSQSPPVLLLCKKCSIKRYVCGVQSELAIYGVDENEITRTHSRMKTFHFRCCF